MRKKILDRYSRREDGSVAIEITAEGIEDLYNNFDKLSPFSKKELNIDLADYLTESVREIGSNQFVISFHFTRRVVPELHSRVQSSIKNYFLYLIELEKRKVAQMIRASAIYLLIGFTILSITVWFNKSFRVDDNAVHDMLSEGLTVAAWVSLWQALADFLINWKPSRRSIRVYRQIVEAPVEFVEKQKVSD